MRGGGHDLGACASHNLSAEAAPLGQETTAASSERGAATTVQATSDTCVSGNDGGAQESFAHADAHAAGCHGYTQQPKPDTVVETPVAKAAKQAGALKIAGNESFRTKNFQAAYDAYTTALDALDAAGLVPPPQPLPPSTPPPSLVDNPPPKEERRLSEAAALRGILHRNRAAVALRMFESSSAAVAAGGGDTASSQPDGGIARGAGDGDDALDKSADRRILHATRTEAGSGRAGRRALPLGEEERRKEREEEEEEKALALLERCESDCLSAIEIDAADKKAHFRLARCREMRRRCRRQGLAAALGEENGLEQERR